ncbi:short chain dehydrogenase [Xylariomycetidae sp. FL0641]|nr:short chain dehydrogenase [Xylariomycetidae sp. FL0641]
MDTSALFRVDGMVAVITGGGTGIGLTMAKALAGAGAKKVYILGRRKAVLDEAAASHPALSALECDVSSKASLQAAVDAVTADMGYVNLLIANSGTVGPEARYDGPTPGEGSVAEMRKRMFEEVDMDAFTQTLHVNVTGALFTFLAFLELLDAGNAQGGIAGTSQESGVPAVQSQCIFTASISAYSRSHMSAVAYGASKAALAHVMKQASTNVRKYGIRVNALAPGLFPSDLARSMIGDRDPAAESPDELRFIPARRFGGDEEMAGTVLYLASRAGSYCNGLVLVHDGGKLTCMPSEY